MFNSVLFQPKTAAKLIGSLPLCGNSHVLKALIKVAGTNVNRLHA
jgi:hypothetical protein